MPPKISIILTSYNKPETVGKAIESVLNQTLKDWELLIMDDASNMITTKIIKSYLKDYRIYYFNSKIKDEDRHKTTRYATLINQAIAISKGKYISYLTDDSEYLPERLEVMSNYLDRNPQINIVYSEQIFRKLNEDFKVIFQGVRRTKGVLSKAANIVDHCSVMHTRKAIERVRRKYKNYWDDHPNYWHNGDAVAWERLNEFYSFYPIKKPLDINNKTPYSFQILNAFLPDTILDGTLIKGLSPEIYLIENQKRRKVSEGMFRKLKYKKEKIVQIPDPFVFKYPLGAPIDETIFNNGRFPNQLLVKEHKSQNIYYIQNSQKRPISQLAMKRYQLKYEDMVPLDQENLQSLKNGPSIRVVITENTILPDGILFTCNGKYYISQNNFLFPIYYKYLQKLGFSMSESVKMTAKELEFFKQGPPITWSYFKNY